MKKLPKPGNKSDKRIKRNNDGSSQGPRTVPIPNRQVENLIIQLLKGLTLLWEKLTLD